MERREFLTNVTITIAGTCAVCLGACSKGSSGGYGGGGGGGGGGGTVNFNVDLNSNLLTVGATHVQSGVIVVRIANGNDAASFTAVQVNCTHENFHITFNTGGNIFICPNHGSQFSVNGTVLNGPATTNLRRYNVAVNGTTLTVTS